MADDTLDTEPSTAQEEIERQAAEATISIESQAGLQRAQVAEQAALAAKHAVAPAPPPGITRLSPKLPVGIVSRAAPVGSAEAVIRASEASAIGQIGTWESTAKEAVSEWEEKEKIKRSEIEPFVVFAVETDEVSGEEVTVLDDEGSPVETVDYVAAIDAGVSLETLTHFGITQEQIEGANVVLEARAQIPAEFTNVEDVHELDIVGAYAYLVDSGKPEEEIHQLFDNLGVSDENIELASLRYGISEVIPVEHITTTVDEAGVETETFDLEAIYSYLLDVGKSDEEIDEAFALINLEPADVDILSAASELSEYVTTEEGQEVYALDKAVGHFIDDAGMTEDEVRSLLETAQLDSVSVDAAIDSYHETKEFEEEHVLVGPEGDEEWIPKETTVDQVGNTVTGWMDLSDDARQGIQQLGVQAYNDNVLEANEQYSSWITENHQIGGEPGDPTTGIWVPLSGYHYNPDTKERVSSDALGATYIKGWDEYEDWEKADLAQYGEVRGRIELEDHGGNPVTFVQGDYYIGAHDPGDKSTAEILHNLGYDRPGVERYVATFLDREKKILSADEHAVEQGWAVWESYDKSHGYGPARWVTKEMRLRYLDGGTPGTTADFRKQYRDNYDATRKAATKRAYSAFVSDYGGGDKWKEWSVRLGESTFQTLKSFIPAVKGMHPGYDWDEVTGVEWAMTGVAVGTLALPFVGGAVAKVTAPVVRPLVAGAKASRVAGLAEVSRVPLLGRHLATPVRELGIVRATTSVGVPRTGVTIGQLAAKPMVPARVLGRELVSPVGEGPVSIGMIKPRLRQARWSYLDLKRRPAALFGRHVPGVERALATRPVSAITPYTGRAYAAGWGGVEGLGAVARPIGGVARGARTADIFFARATTPSGALQYGRETGRGFQRAGERAWSRLRTRAPVDEPLLYKPSPYGAGEAPGVSEFSMMEEYLGESIPSYHPSAPQLPHQIARRVKTEEIFGISEKRAPLLAEPTRFPSVESYLGSREVAAKARYQLGRELAEEAGIHAIVPTPVPGIVTRTARRVRQIWERPPELPVSPIGVSRFASVDEIERILIGPPGAATRVLGRVERALSGRRPGYARLGWEPSPRPSAPRVAVQYADDAPTPLVEMYAPAKAPSRPFIEDYPMVPEVVPPPVKTFYPDVSPYTGVGTPFAPQRVGIPGLTGMQKEYLAGIPSRIPLHPFGTGGFGAPAVVGAGAAPAVRTWFTPEQLYELDREYYVGAIDKPVGAVYPVVETVEIPGYEPYEVTAPKPERAVRVVAEPAVETVVEAPLAPGAISPTGPTYMEPYPVEGIPIRETPPIRKTPWGPPPILAPALPAFGIAAIGRGRKRASQKEILENILGVKPGVVVVMPEISADFADILAPVPQRKAVVGRGRELRFKRVGSRRKVLNNEQLATIVGA